MERLGPKHVIPAHSTWIKPIPKWNWYCIICHYVPFSVDLEVPAKQNRIYFFLLNGWLEIHSKEEKAQEEYKTEQN